VSLKVYKSLKALVQLAAVATAIVAINAGADPLTVYALVAVLVAGPEAYETAIANGGEQ